MKYSFGLNEKDISERDSYTTVISRIKYLFAYLAALVIDLASMDRSNISATMKLTAALKINKNVIFS